MGIDHIHRGRAAALSLAAFLLAACVVSGREVARQDPTPAIVRVLVFTRTEGFRHDSIPDGVDAVRTLGAQHGFAVDWTEDAATFTDATLAQYRAVIFLSTTGDVLDEPQQAAFERYIRAGHGYVGIHSASDTEYDWSWYGELVGAYFRSHPEIQLATIHIEDPSHPSTKDLPAAWLRTDEWYDFRASPRGKVQVLATLNESTYSGGSMGSDHPIAWFHAYDGGRAWYTAGGHTGESYNEPLFLQHILGGILYAAGMDPNPIGSLPPAAALKVFDGTSTAAWESIPGRAPIAWPVVDGALEVCPGCGDIRTREVFDDFRLHLEFWLPRAAPDAPAQDRSNSGVYLQGRYELQVLDSFGLPLVGADGAGAIYGARDANTNAALPAETWPTYDVVFRAARWNGLTKTEPTTVTVWWNGVQVHDAVRVPGSTAGGLAETPELGPIVLQDHGHQVLYRNIWLVPLSV